MSYIDLEFALDQSFNNPDWSWIGHSKLSSHPLLNAVKELLSTLKLDMDPMVLAKQIIQERKMLCNS